MSCVTGAYTCMHMHAHVLLPTPHRASTALQVAFQVPVDLQDYVEVSPRHGVVQGDSSFSAQVKFQPVESLLGLRKYYTPASDKWRMPVHVGVANQVRT